jgi:hypothetical protein
MIFIIPGGESYLCYAMALLLYQSSKFKFEVFCHFLPFSVNFLLDLFSIL